MKRKSSLIDVFSGFVARLHRGSYSAHVTSEQVLLTEVEEARLEWLAAREYFDTVVDPGLIDYAIHVCQATERRYMYLLAEARSRGINSGFPLPKKD